MAAALRRIDIDSTGLFAGFAKVAALETGSPLPSDADRERVGTPASDGTLLTISRRCTTAYPAICDVRGRGLLRPQYVDSSHMGRRDFFDLIDFLEGR